MRVLIAISILISAGAALAQSDSRQGRPPGDATALDKPWSILSERPSAIRGDPRLTDTVPPPRQPSAWERIQDPLDRSIWRITDDQLYEVEEIERQRDERFDRREPLSERELLEQQRERQLRLEERRRRIERLSAGHDRELERRRELDLREYLLYVNNGLTPTARQAEADRIALREAQAQRDRGLLELMQRYNESLRRRGADRQALRRDYEQARGQIRMRYEETRARILGVE
jgi:hypothetical protein